MDFLSIEALQAVDERACLATPMGLGLTDVASANRLHQQAVAQFVLTEASGEATRETFERLKRTYVYGILHYELYTLVEEQARFVLELALRERFIDFYHGQVTLLDGDTRSTLTCETFEDVRVAMRSPDRSSKWRIELTTGEVVPFEGSLRGLLDWARFERLLRGQRNRSQEEAFVSLRNATAHPQHFKLVGPVDALNTLGHLTEVINHLYGETTPGGRFYPPRLDRRPMAFGWSKKRRIVSDVVHLTAVELDDRRLQWAIVLAPDLDSVWDLDTLHETTYHPIDVIWGPGDWTDACAWATANDPQGDQVKMLDRWFVVREVEPVLPQRPEVAAGLARADRKGRWVLVQADNPFDVVGHVRHRLRGENECPQFDRIRTCHVRHECKGTLQAVLRRYEKVSGSPPAPVSPRPVRTSLFD